MVLHWRKSSRCQCLYDIMISPCFICFLSFIFILGWDFCCCYCCCYCLLVCLFFLFFCRKPTRIPRFSPSFAFLHHVDPCCPTLSFLQRRFSLPTDVTPFVTYRSRLRTVHLLSFIRTMCPTHFHIAYVMYFSMFVTPLLCLMISVSDGNLPPLTGSMKGKKNGSSE